MRSFDKPVPGTGSGLALAGPGARTQVHHHSAHSGDAATAGRAPRPARPAAAPPRNVTGFHWPLGDVSACGTRTTSWEFPGEPRDAPLPTPQWAGIRQGSLGGRGLALTACPAPLLTPARKASSPPPPAQLLSVTVTGVAPPPPAQCRPRSCPSPWASVFLGYLQGRGAHLLIR